VLTVLKSAAAEDLEGKIWHIEGKPSRKGLVEPLRTCFEGIQPGLGALSPAERTDPINTKIRSEWPASIVVMSTHLYSLFPSPQATLAVATTFVSSPFAGTLLSPSSLPLEGQARIRM
jgi:hypothetical protein